MAWFDIGDLPEGDWPLVAEADQSLVAIRGILKSEYDLTEGRGALTNAGCLEFYRQHVGRRIVDLTDAISLLWKAGLQVPCIIQVRALLETTVSINYSFELISASVKKQDWKSVHEQITRAAFSSRDKEKIAQNDLHETTNILTQMKKLPGNVRNSISTFYEQVSDHCHPNGYAMYQRYGDLINYKFYAMPPDYKKEITFQAVYNATVLVIFCALLLEDIGRVQDSIRRTEPPPRDFNSSST